MLFTIIMAAVAAVLALIAWYEYQLAQLSDLAADLLDKVGEMSDLATDPPFNLQLDDPVLVEAFKLRSVPPRYPVNEHGDRW